MLAVHRKEWETNFVWSNDLLFGVLNSQPPDPSSMLQTKVCSSHLCQQKNLTCACTLVIHVVVWGSWVLLLLLLLCGGIENDMFTAVHPTTITVALHIYGDLKKIFLACWVHDLYLPPTVVRSYVYFTASVATICHMLYSSHFTATWLQWLHLPSVTFDLTTFVAVISPSNHYGRTIYVHMFTSLHLLILPWTFNIVQHKGCNNYICHL